MATKIDAAKPNLKAKLHDAITAWVRETLEDSSVSYSSFLGPSAFETHVLREKRATSLYRAFRKKMIDRRLWSELETILAQERFMDLFTREIKRQERAASDDAQFTLPGFENSNLPQKIRTGRNSVPLEKVSVGQYLAFADGYEKRTRKNETVGAEVLKLAGMIRDQPAELSVPEALARVTGSGLRKTS
jgi:hypothetical protein